MAVVKQVVVVRPCLLAISLTMRMLNDICKEVLYYFPDLFSLFRVHYRLRTHIIGTRTIIVPVRSFGESTSLLTQNTKYMYLEGETDFESPETKPSRTRAQLGSVMTNTS